ncbi:hypothetical protein C5167_044837 [Papaver somniferum]|nr:hypothetical protein C5167_044832 [Papaver somniferum]RZC90205.1 hypothetical protein C5167_044837 [Papaver somniferum]
MLLDSRMTVSLSRAQHDNSILFVANAQTRLVITAQVEPYIISTSDGVTEVFLTVLDMYIRWCKCALLVWNRTFEEAVLNLGSVVSVI